MSIQDKFSFGKPKQVLVCETDGFSLKAAVLTRNNGVFSILYQGVVHNPDMAEALPEVIADLKKQGWQGGKAVLLSPAVLSTLVELPVNPKKPRPIAQMMELVRWEVEPLLMQHTTRWSVGHLLVGQGYLSSEQADAVLDLQQGNANEAGGLELAEKFSFRKFGDLAEELGYVRRSQISACLSGQEWLKFQSENEDIACGWAPQGEVADIPGMYNWLVSCVNQDLLSRWTALFAKENIILQAMYPQTGLSVNLLDEEVSSAIVVESTNRFAFTTHIQDGKILSQNYYIDQENSALKACLESIHSINAPVTEPLMLADWQLSDSLAEELNHTLEREITVINNPIINTIVSPGMMAAASHIYNVNLSHALTTDVRLDGPPPALKERIEVRFMILIAVLLVMLVISEISLALRLNSVEHYKAEIDLDWSMIDGATKRVNKQITEIEKQKKELEQQKIEQIRYSHMVHFYGEDIPQRVELVKNILGLIQSRTPDDVIIKQIDELGPRASVLPKFISTKPSHNEVENFNLEAWALTEEAAQNFVSTIKQALLQIDQSMTVRDVLVRSEIGPLGLEGFTVGFRIVKLISVDAP